MGLIDRLGDVLKSYLNDEEEEKSSQKRNQRFTDPDVEAAYKELNDYLKGGSERKKSAPGNAEDFAGTFYRPGARPPPQKPEIPPSIQQDFAELGLSPGAGPEECKAAYKKLLKIHHPDRHAGHPGNMQKATEKSARINAAFDRIERWHQTGKAD